MRTWGLGIGSILLGLLLACGGGSGPTPPPARTAPSELRIVRDWYFDVLELGWNPPETPMDGYELEAQVGSSNYQKIHQDLIPASWKGAEITFTALPENKTVRLRLRAVRGTQGSGYSNEVSFDRGLRPLGGVSYTVSVAQVLLEWTADSRTTADQVRIERAEVANGTTGSFSTVGTAGLATRSFADRSVAEDTRYQYRVIPFLNEKDGPPFSVPVVLTPLLKATSLATQAEANGIRLSWKNQSLAGKEIQVLRAPGQDNASALQPIATLPPSAETFVDVPPLPGYYTYGIKTKGPIGSADSSSVSCATSPGADPNSVETTPLTMPTAIHVARDSSQAWWLAGELNRDLLLFSPQGAEWTSSNLGKFSYLVSPGIRFDASGHPHLMTATYRDGAHDLEHLTWSSSGWTRTMLHRTNLFFIGTPAFAFALSPAGRLRLAYIDTPAGSSTRRPSLWMETETTPVIEPIPTTGIDTSNIRRITMAVGLDDTVFIALALENNYGALFLRRSPEGTWQQEVFPATLWTPTGSPFSLLFSPQGPTHLLTRTITNGQMALTYHAAESGTWKAPEVLTPVTFGLTGMRTALVVPQAGQPVAFASLPTGVTLFRRTSSAAWDPLLIAPETSEVWMGLRSDGRPWTLVKGGASADGKTSQYALVESKAP